ncbi:MAG: hypothetical protein M3Z16_04040, partial [Pseudomonadota bacterium]|nr:hypothetical protein [Pseudomonadota bacterium]
MPTAPRLSDAAAAPAAAVPLPDGTRLRDYEITGLISRGAWAIIYLAWDHSLQRQVAIKEYLPAALAARAADTVAVEPSADRLSVYRAGLKSFIGEARMLARFDHPSLLKVYRFWEERGTAYMVMPLYTGPTLAVALAELGRVPSEMELRTWMRPILDALAHLHHGGSVHLNVSPEAIVLTPIGPVLLAPDANRKAVAGSRGASSSVLKSGFAAPEQYPSATAVPGPAADLYSLAAILYAAIAGAPPPPGDARQARDTLQPLSLLAAGLYDDRFLSSIDATLAVDAALRPQNDAAFREAMGGLEVADGAVLLLPPSDPMQAPFVGDVEARREITVPDHPLLIGEPIPPAPETASPQRVKSRLRLPFALAAAQPGTPEWADTQQADRPPMNALPRRRWLYGFVASSFVVVGLGTLALQYATRQTGRATAVAAPAPRTDAPALDRVGDAVSRSPAAASTAPAAAVIAVAPAAASQSRKATAGATPAPASMVSMAPAGASAVGVASVATAVKTTATGPTPTAIGTAAAPRPVVPASVR